MATITGTEGADTITSATNSADGPTATGSNDRINGLSGDDRLAGGGGADTLVGGKGRDTLLGEDGNDRVAIAGESLIEIDDIDGGPGRDTLDLSAWGTLHFLRVDLVANQVQGGLEANLLVVVAFLAAGTIESAIGSGFDDVMVGDNDANVFDGRAGADTLQGGAAADTLYGDSGNDLLEGGTGNDSLLGQSDADTLDGGAGVDWAAYAGLALALGVTLAADGTSVTSGAAEGDVLIGIEHVQGGGGADTLVAEDPGANLLLGEVGNDVLGGGAGDTLIGGGDSDTYILLDPGVTIVESAQARVRDRVESPFDFTLPTEVEDLLLTGTAYFGRGNTADNGITGNGRANLLVGGDGNDTLDGGAGADVMLGGAGFDLFRVDHARDVVLDEPDAPGHVVATLNWVLGADLGPLMLSGLLARAGTGNARDNLLVGSEAANRIFGQGGADTVQGGEGNDLLRGGTGNDRVEGGIGRDTLHGDAGADTLVAGSDNAALNGGADDDVLIGGAGADLLNGGGGADAFHLAVDTLAVDRVGDFSAAAGDRLVVFGTGLAAGALDPLAFAANTSGLATTAEQRLIHETDQGRLWFDADGSAAVETRILVATFTGNPHRRGHPGRLTRPPPARCRGRAAWRAAARAVNLAPATTGDARAAGWPGR
ncbi:hypothetical protein DFH01_22780 [Falsiroseomonas bella]|uniref:Calcium-binding protein n=1 Tax=Falsiroseomonas bella TaxID=2184016 RepID=A0A317F7L9_9PROT|nr:calcium-binding protein [Falsiroseomonas bella]PWS35140.1 hypothetical protein DFH01_22780 [Falsiroseomonas bella]